MMKPKAYQDELEDEINRQRINELENATFTLWTEKSEAERKKNKTSSRKAATTSKSERNCLFCPYFTCDDLMVILSTIITPRNIHDSQVFSSSSNNRRDFS